MNPSVVLITSTLVTFLNIYVALILFRILVPWLFPLINWYDPPFSFVSQLTDPYLNIFRSIIPPLGGLDFSPILAIFLLQFLARTLASFGSGPALGF